MDSVKKKNQNQKKKKIYFLFMFVCSLCCSVFCLSIIFVGSLFTDRNHSGKAKTFLTMSFEVR